MVHSVCVAASGVELFGAEFVFVLNSDGSVGPQVMNEDVCFCEAIKTPISTDT